MMIDSVMAYLTPFYLHQRFEDPIARAHVQSIVGFDIGVINSVYFEGIDMKSLIHDKIKGSVELERAFLRGIIESTHFGLGKDCITFLLPQKMRMPVRDFILEIFHEKVSSANTQEFRMSWELFSHIVFMTIYRDSSKYNAYNEKICRHFNIPKFLNEANAAAKNSKCQKMQVGSVLVVDGMVKVKGWNFHPKGTRRDHVCLRMNTPHAMDISHGYCVHAELQVIMRSSAPMLKKGVLFVTHPPCEHCARHIIQTQIPLVIFERGDYPTTGIDLAYDLAGNTRFFGV